MTLKFVELYGSLTLQSEPAPGRRNYGVPVGGAFDQESHALANALLGNETACPTIELSAAGARIEVLEGGTLSWVGAGAFQGCRDFEPGDLLELPYPRSGCRSYLGLSGGVNRSGDRVFASRLQRRARNSTLAESPNFAEIGAIRVIRSQSFGNLHWESLLSASFKVNPNSNRIGVRLIASPSMTHHIDRPSEPTDVGVIQLPPSGQPILLGPDGPTIGGYPVLGSVAMVDLKKVGQLVTGDLVRFREVVREEAIRLDAEACVELERRALLLRAHSEIDI